jgi:nicotinate-nucleotide adenylyltransferase
LIAAGDAHAILGVDIVLWIPAAEPPHKLAVERTRPDLRLAMVNAAVAGDDRFQADDLELQRWGPSYTVDTLRELRGRWPGADPTLLLGADALRDLPTWREPEEVARLARLAVLNRLGDGVPGSPFAALPVPVTRVDISATEIRRRVRENVPIRHLVPDSVRHIIENERLYIAT